MFSRSVASSRAIPVAKQMERIAAEPFVPTSWGRNEPGMVASANLDAAAEHAAEAVWRTALDDMLEHTQALMNLGVHKQLANRLLEVFSYTTEIVTATEWDNFFLQRTHPDAQPEIQAIAVMTKAVYDGSTPREIVPGEWHLPFADGDDVRALPLQSRKRLSAARCARTSYLTHDGKRDVLADLGLFERLVAGGANGHLSPMEHQATPMHDSYGRSGNFIGWFQWRREFEPNLDIKLIAEG